MPSLNAMVADQIGAAAGSESQADMLMRYRDLLAREATPNGPAMPTA